MKNRIGLKLILAVGSVTVLSFGLFSSLLIYSHYQGLIAQVVRATNKLNETVRSSTKYYMLRNHRRELRRVINTIARQDGISQIRILNKDGEIAFSSKRGDTGRVVDQDSAVCHGCHTAEKPRIQLALAERMRFLDGPAGERRLGMMIPIYNEARCTQGACHVHDPDQKVLGVLDITTSLKDVDRDLRASRNQVVVFAACVVVLISVVLWWLMQRLVGRPVSRLVEATNRVATGQLDYQMPVTSNDELGDLGRSFNEMTRELSDAHRQIYQQDRLASLGRLSAGVAHELNNPLTGILTFSSVLLKKADGEDREDLAVIVRETKRCRDIVKSLLDFARQVPPRLESVSLNQVVRQAEIILENQLTLQKAAMEQDLAEKLPPVTGDPGRLQQVVVNLLVNAIDALGDNGGTISVATSLVSEEGSDRLRLTVRDTGTGIPPENLGRIFEPFFSTKGIKGTGLGLSVVWGIIEEHHGRISVESTVGKGTTFTVVLPVEK